MSVHVRTNMADRGRETGSGQPFACDRPRRLREGWSAMAVRLRIATLRWPCRRVLKRPLELEGKTINRTQSLHLGDVTLQIEKKPRQDPSAFCGERSEKVFLSCGDGWILRYGEVDETFLITHLRCFNMNTLGREGGVRHTCPSLR